MGKKFNYTAHKDLWDWLSKNPDKRKENWPGWKENGGNHENDGACCFACEYTRSNRESCPLVTGRDCGVTGYFGSNRCLGGLFRDWETCYDKTERSYLASQIRDLPVREDVECI